MGIVNAILFSFTDKYYGMVAFISVSFVSALPGIVIQIALIPPIIYALKKSRLMS